MPFRPSRKQPEFANLKGILAQYKQPDNALYQTVQEIIERLVQFQDVTLEKIDDNLTTVQSGFATRTATYLTTENEVPSLPLSVQLLAGEGITFDDTVANQRTISSSGSGTCQWYDAPLTDGDVDDTGFIFALGECVIVQVPNV